MSGSKWKTVDPKTGKKLGNRFGFWMMSVFGVVLLAAAGFAAYQMQNKEREKLAIPVEVEPQNVLTIHGSNTLGASLIPKLAERFLLDMGALTVEAIQGESPVEVDIMADFPNGEGKKFIRIQAHGSSTGFKGLRNNLCDIGASSRPIKESEAIILGRLGYGVMTEHTNEHVVALDGVAVIVHPDNPVSRLDIEQIAQIYSGEIANWREVGGRDVPINLYARDEKSGTYDTFRSMVMGKTREIKHWARRYEDSMHLYEMVMKDPLAIGFIGLPYIREAKALAVSAGGAMAVEPTYATVKAEAYPLARRLYFYTSETPENPLVSKFVAFARSDRGQQLARVSNLVDLSLDVAPEEDVKAPEFFSTNLYEETVGQAEFLVAVRFDLGSEALDNRARDDLNRLAALMRNPKFKRRNIILVGHTDRLGSPETNRMLSLERANNVKRLLGETGINVDKTFGFGMEAPVADNTTAEGRRRNRRVEIFLGS